MKKYDAVIIGGGVIGSAIAYEISRQPLFPSVALLEKNDAPCLETSLANSGVIHSGIHLDPSSLKAQLALRGRNNLIELCGSFGISHEKRGMIVVGSSPRELAELDTLRRRATIQHIPANIIGSAEIRRREPAIKAFSGLLVEDVFIIDPQKFSLKLLAEAQKEQRTELYTASEVLSIERRADSYILHTATERFETSAIINAAGLYADKVAAMAGYRYQLEFYSGEYYHVTNKEKAAALNGALIYPAPLPGDPGLGTHITKKLNGEVYLGPNAQRSEGPVFDPRRRTDPELFIRDVKPFWPAIEAKDIEWGYVGMRPKIADGSCDFLIKKESDAPAFINLLGIESPGLTAAMAIAKMALDLLTPQSSQR